MVEEEDVIAYSGETVRTLNRVSLLTAALVAFQADPPRVVKDAINPAFKARYATLGAFQEAILPALAKHDLAWSAQPTLQDGEFILHYELRHTSGETIEGCYPLTVGRPQDMGSQITYAVKYSFSAVTGIAADDDDDGDTAQTAPPSTDFLAVAEGESTADAVLRVWQMAKAARAPKDVLDAIGERGRKLREAEATATEPVVES